MAVVAGERPRPETVAQLLRRPSLVEWDAERRDGWPGPDGSSCSLDDIEGIRIGVTHAGWIHSDLPANRHDWLYRLGRKHRLGRAYRKAADVVYRDLCLEHVAVLVGWNGWKARQRCHIRYRALRLFGWKAWRQKAKRAG